MAAVAAAGGERGTSQTERKAMWVYVGTYTRGSSKGIYLCHLDLATGRLSSAELAGETANPSFLALHLGKPLLYAVGEMGSSAKGKGGAVSAFSIAASSGKLTLLSQQSSGGAGPCHLVVDHTGRFVLVANYGSGSVACLPIQEDGRLGEATSFIQHEGSSVDPKRQTGPHAHGIYLDAANRFAFVPDLGLDKIMIYRLDAAQGQLVPHEPPSAGVAPGSGPRHFALHPNGRFAYVINELNSTLTAFACNAKRGALETLQTLSTLPEGFSGSNTCAEVQVHPSGKFLYGSNRGHDSIALFAIDPDTGRLRYLAHESTRGKTPRNFAIDPTGTYLLAANQDTNNIVVFRIDAASGKLVASGDSVGVGSPVCIQFLRPLH
jgi:6-phosphogluconolactonase